MVVAIEAGRLRHRVTLQEYAAIRDGAGGEGKDWRNVATVWASVEPIQGREYFAAQQVNAEVSHRIRMRFRPGVNPKMRAIFGGRIFNIETAINVEERNVELQLMCVEEVTA